MCGFFESIKNSDKTQKREDGSYLWIEKYPKTGKYHCMFWKNSRAINPTMNILSDSREDIQHKISMIMEREQKRKTEQEKARRLIKMTKANFVEGDILYVSYGYSMTLVNFYRVLKVYNKTVVLELLPGKRVYDDGSCLVPDFDRTIKNPEIRRCRVSMSVYGEETVVQSVKIDNNYARKWDGRPLPFDDRD